MRRLIVRPGGIGDFVVSLPAMEFLREGYLEVWTARQNVPLARFADNARAMGATRLDLLGVVEPPSGLIDRLRSFDDIISWYGANRPEFRASVASLGLPFRFLPALPPEGSAIHAVDYYWRQVTDAGAAPTPRLQVGTRDPSGAVIHPFSGSPRKNWPLERYRELAARLEVTMPVRWCAGPEEELDGAMRIDDLYELACWLAGARVYIGNDSGITHLAAATGTPVVALFGPTDPAVWAPRGPRVRVIAKADLVDIAVAEVLEACLRRGDSGQFRVTG